jgi:hypothetical protein
MQKKLGDYVKVLPICRLLLFLVSFNTKTVFVSNDLGSKYRGGL